MPLQSNYTLNHGLLPGAWSWNQFSLKGLTGAAQLLLFEEIRTCKVVWVFVFSAPYCCSLPSLLLGQRDNGQGRHSGCPVW